MERAYVRRSFGPEEKASREPGTSAIVPRLPYSEFLHRNSSQSSSSESHYDSAVESQSVEIPKEAPKTPDMVPIDVADSGDFDFDDLDRVIAHIQSPPIPSSPGAVSITPIMQERFSERFPPPKIPPPEPVSLNTPGRSTAIDLEHRRTPQLRQSPYRTFNKPPRSFSESTQASEISQDTHNSQNSQISAASRASSGLRGSIRQACRYPASLLRQPPHRSTMVPLPARPLLAGIAPTPAFPSKGVLVDGKPVDMWGRPECSPLAASIVIVVATAFPPLWLLLGSGFFDNVLGVLPRRAKQVALFLGLFAFTAAATFAIVFCLVGRP